MSQKGSARGCFITLEGPEGSGKSTQARQLVSLLKRKGYAVTMLRDPGSTSLGRSLRRVLLHSEALLSPLAEALLFIGGRVALVEERIRPALGRGAVVVCDRFHDSTMAYQGFGGRLNVPWLQRVGRTAIHGVMPHLTLLLDLPVAAGFTRLHHSRDRMERKARSFHERVRRGFLALARHEPRRFVVINASQSAAEVRQQIETSVMRCLWRVLT